jgi:hypothetical protein
VRSYLLPISDRDALAWIVREQLTAFGDNRAREARALEVGDELFLYTTRGLYRNPTRDRGRVVGRASVLSAAKSSSNPPTFGGREFPHVVRLRIENLAPFREGLELAPLVPRLTGTFPDASTWSVRMRRALVPLDSADAKTIRSELRGAVIDYAAASPSYQPTSR